MKLVFCIIVPFATLAYVMAGKGECNGNGRIFEYSTTCECFPCFSGPTCEVLSSLDECIIDTSAAGQPALLEEYWENTDVLDVKIPAKFRTQYSSYLNPVFPDSLPSTHPVSRSLYSSILKLHEQVNNVKLDQHVLVLGLGATELTNAAIYALSAYNSPEIASVFAKAPHYDGYESFANSPLSSGFAIFNSSLDMELTNNIIEFVTIPNNPDFTYRTAHYHDTAKLIYDCAYLWPSFSNRSINYKLNEDMMVFTLSKLTGHASSRIGWAWVRDPVVALKMKEFIDILHLQIPIETLVYANLIIDNVVENNGQLYDFAKSELASRWDSLKKFFQESKEFEILSPRGSYYLWIKCKEATDCFDYFKIMYEIIGESGETFGVSNEYLRINLMVRSSTFNIIMKKLSLNHKVY